MTWAVATTETFDEWFAELGEAGQAEVIAKVNLLKLLGPRLGRPHDHATTRPRDHTLTR